jgi:hypothetical protein
MKLSPGKNVPFYILVIFADIIEMTRVVSSTAFGWWQV